MDIQNETPESRGAEPPDGHVVSGLRPWADSQAAQIMDPVRLALAPFATLANAERDERGGVWFDGATLDAVAAVPELIEIARSGISSSLWLLILRERRAAADRAAAAAPEAPPHENPAMLLEALHTLFAPIRVVAYTGLPDAGPEIINGLLGYIAEFGYVLERARDRAGTDEGPLVHADLFGLIPGQDAPGPKGS